MGGNHRGTQGASCSIIASFTDSLVTRSCEPQQTNCNRQPTQTLTQHPSAITPAFEPAVPPEMPE
ncbi:hypothetical protein BaRGS_00021136, partial [Batillaria attramentaria]